MSLTVTLIGCGKMGGALLRGWLDAGLIAHAFVIDPAPLPAEFAAHSHKLTAFPDSAAYKAAAPQSDIVILAVKPQIMDDVCAALRGAFTAETPILSIAAGRTLASFSAFFGAEQPLIRTMPNTPAAIGKGMTALIANAHATSDHKERASRLMQAAGHIVWLDDEASMDAVTALSGSGPAYIFLLIETLAAAGVKIGLEPDAAMTLARQTVIGAAALAEQDAATPAATLRENVTSPGGTTAAALKILMDGRLQKLFDEALAAAAERSRALS